MHQKVHQRCSTHLLSDYYQTTIPLHRPIFTVVRYGGIRGYKRAKHIRNPLLWPVELRRLAGALIAGFGVELRCGAFVWRIDSASGLGLLVGNDLTNVVKSADMDSKVSTIAQCTFVDTRYTLVNMQYGLVNM